MVHTWIAEISALREEETYRKYYERVPDLRISSGFLRTGRRA